MSKVLLKTKMFEVRELEVKIRSRKMKVDVVAKRDTVVILPITRKGYVLLERQYRPPIGKWLYEAPAGHLEKGEKPAKAANRELEEETGLKAKRLKFLMHFYPSPGILNNREYFYLAEGLEKGKLSLDKDEEIKVEEMSIAKALDYIRSGRIVDAKTIIAILYYCRFIGPK